MFKRRFNFLLKMYGYRKQLNLAWSGKGAWKKMYLHTLKSLNNSPFIWVKYIFFIIHSAGLLLDEMCEFHQEFLKIC